MIDRDSDRAETSSAASAEGEGPAPPESARPLQIARFGLKLLAWLGFAMLLFSLVGGYIGIVLGGLAFLIVAYIWGAVRVPNEIPGAAEPPYPVSGSRRLTIELVIIALGAFGWSIATAPIAGIAVLAAAVLLYGFTWKRQAWLVRQ